MSDEHTDVETSEDLKGLFVPRIGLVPNPANFPHFLQLRSEADMPADRQTIEVPAGMVELFRTIGEALPDCEARIREAEVLRGEKADAMMQAVSAALAVLEPLKSTMEHDDFARLASIAGYTVGDLAWLERAEAAVARCDALDAEAEAQRQAQEAQARSEYPLTEAGDLDIEQVPESVRGIVRSAWDREQEVRTREATVEAKEAEQAEAEAQRLAQAEEDEVVQAMRSFGDLPGDQAMRHEALLRARRTDTEIYGAMIELWTQEAAAARAPMQEIGSSAESTVAGGGRKAAEQIAEQRAKKMMDADPSLTRAQAECKVWANDPKLYEQYRYDR